MTTFYTHCQVPQTYSCPWMLTEWCPNTYLAPVLNFPPTVITTETSPLWTYIDMPMPVDPVIPIVPAHTVANEYNDSIINYVKGCPLQYTDQSASPSISVSDEIQYITDIIDENVPEEVCEEVDHKDEDPIEFYLNLPKELFPTAQMLTIDPNPIIDEFCKISDISENVSWILDLEFGVPRVPVTRAIATYDVKFNSVHCKNTPSAIHPGFEKCNGDFRRVILFYYDCIVSNWYNGYIILKNDKSVENFQAWLSIPMQMFGMCWP